jgi:hypothetical protein
VYVCVLYCKQGVKHTTKTISYWIRALRNLVEIIFSKIIHKNTRIYLKDVIEEYLKSLVKIFCSTKTLKPSKHHFLIHYPRTMKYVGPLPFINSMRFESKHRSSKQTAAVSLSRVNLPKTLALKHQLILTERFLKNQEFHDNFECGPVSEIQLTKLIKEKLNIKNVKNAKKTNWVKYHNLEIEEGTVVMYPIECSVKFYVVESVLLLEDIVGFFVFAKKLKVLYD